MVPTHSPTYVCVFPRLVPSHICVKELNCSVVPSPLGRASMSANYEIFFSVQRPTMTTFTTGPKHYCHYFLKNHLISTAKNWGGCSSWSAAQGDSLPNLQSLILRTLLTTKDELCFIKKKYRTLFFLPCYW